jgi:hypothetical protein
VLVRGGFGIAEEVEGARDRFGEVPLEALDDLDLGSRPVLVQLDRASRDAGDRGEDAEGDSPFLAEMPEPRAVDPGEDPARAAEQERRDPLLQELLEALLHHDRDPVPAVHDPRLEGVAPGRLADDEHFRREQSAELRDPRRFARVERVDVLQDLDDEELGVAPGHQVEAARTDVVGVGDEESGPFEELAHPLDRTVPRSRPPRDDPRPRHPA